MASKSNICWDCQRACGGCSWSEDFIPVPGWTAEPSIIKQSPGVDIHSYHIAACPLFVPDEVRK